MCVASGLGTTTMGEPFGIFELRSLPVAGSQARTPPSASHVTMSRPSALNTASDDVIAAHGEGRDLAPVSGFRTRGAPSGDVDHELSLGRAESVARNPESWAADRDERLVDSGVPDARVSGRSST